MRLLLVGVGLMYTTGGMAIKCALRGEAEPFRF